MVLVNALQILLFLVYFGALALAGVRAALFMNPQGEGFLNRFVWLAEALLLGSICVIGQLLALSLVHLYSAPFLWGAVLANYLWGLDPAVRRQIVSLVRPGPRWDLPLGGFAVLLLVFLFRNCYFLVDVDSHTIYLYIQRLWLEQGTSLVGGPQFDAQIFVPHFNAVPYALGLSVLPGELFFPQLVVCSWTVIAVLLVFGYVSFRMTRYAALGAVCLVVFNDHLFYSGANAYVIINSALVALLFAIAYNFWEGARGGAGGRFRLVLALVFLGQLMANKYQMLYIMVFFLVWGLAAQPDWRSLWSSVVGVRRYRWALLFSALVMSLWYIKNWLITGLPTFPVLAGTFGTYGWTPEMMQTFNKFYAGPLPLMKFFKYMNYMFIWPGIQAAKIVALTASLLPLTVFLMIRTRRLDQARLAEWCFWLGLCFLFVLGLCLVSFVGPRHYRYAIALFAFTAVYSLDVVLRQLFFIRSGALIGLLVLAMSCLGARIITQQGGVFQRPTIQDNLQVLAGRLRSADMIPRYFRNQEPVLAGIRQDPQRFSQAAWLLSSDARYLSTFSLPTRPQVGLWFSTVVKWDSYDNEDLIVRDLEAAGIHWLMRPEEGRLRFLAPGEYAQEAVRLNRRPAKVFYDYGFPAELTEIHYE